MMLDDRSLREHLDRRAETGVSDVEGIAEVVMTRVAELDRGPWWRRLGVRAPSLGLAAAVVAVLVIALAVLPPRLWPGPGSSPTPSGPAVAAGYPASRALTAGELRTLLAGETARLADAVLIVDVELREATVSCVLLALCPTFAVDFGDPANPIYVVDPRGVASVGAGTYAVHVLGESSVTVFGRVRAGPDGLAWTLPQLTAALADLRADRAVPYLYLVDAFRAISPAAIPCPFAPAPSIGPDFSCAAGIAWLVSDEASIPAENDINAPANSLRVPVPADVRGRSDMLRQPGFWLVDPVVDQEPCFACSPAGAADLIGRVPTAGELGLEPSGTPAPSSASSTSEPTTPPTTTGPTPTADVSVTGIREITFSTDVVRLDGFETADLTVTVTFVDDVVPYHGADASMTPLLYFQRDAGDTGDPLDPHIAQLVRTMRESPVAGVWTATFRLTSGDRGTWHVDGLVAYDADGQEVPIGPAIRDLSPRLEVVGTNVPFLTMEVRPWPVELGQPLEVTGQVTDQDSGDPIGYALLTIGRGDSCGPGGTGSSVRANVNGEYTYAMPAADSPLVCAWMSGDAFAFPSPDSDVPLALYAALFADPQAP
jgi:hypothetical protein